MTKKTKGNFKTVLPTAPFLRGFHIDIDLVHEGVGVCVSGVRGVRSFSDATVELSLPSGAVLIFGEGLSLLLYGQGKAEVRGAVKEVKLSDA